MTSRQYLGFLGCVVAGLGMTSAVAQDQPKLDTREAVNTYYAKQFRALEQSHIQALTKVAAGEQGDAADATYRVLFDLAIARNLYSEAEPAAEQVLEKGSNDPQIRALAHLVNVIAEADRGQYEESLQHLKEFIKNRPQEQVDAKADPSVALAIGEAYFQRLVQAGRYDVAENLCEFACESASMPAVRAWFAEHLERLKRLDQPAPMLTAKTVDGAPIALSDLKGKVVVVDFWATWCPPCSRRMYELNDLYAQHKDDGLVILGVNVD
ncbi:MAG TPA: TlpA disulfide reductase family protein, partial [Isosphaeraceae bacterium]|nr:TlpA disulfide reductase family protein [Isosphaeraceae bacterium]